jgi:hypothetical protein
MGWPDIHWLARDKGGLVAAMFEAWFGFILPMEPELALCGWRCPHRRPTVVMGSIGNLVFCNSLDGRRPASLHPNSTSDLVC